MRPHRGGLILALGILSFLLCGILTAIPAWIMGHGDMKEMDSGTMDPSGRGLTQAGKILGMIHCILWMVAIGVGIVFFLIAVVFAGASSRQ